MKTNTTENPWAEGMKGSHDTSWLGRLWRGVAGAGVAVAQVSNAQTEAVREEEDLVPSGSDHYDNDPYSPENINNPAFHDFRS